MQAVKAKVAVVRRFILVCSVGVHNTCFCENVKFLYRSNTSRRILVEVFYEQMIQNSGHKKLGDFHNQERRVDDENCIQRAN